MKKMIWLFIFGLFFSINIFAQAKEISFDDTHQALVAAFNKEYEGAWRKSLREDFYTDGKPSFSIQTYEEHLKPGTWRRITTAKSGSMNETFQILSINGTFYCRKNNDAWKKSAVWCGENEQFAASLNGEVESAKYSVENTFTAKREGAKLYRQNILYKNDKSQTFWNYNFWVNQEGFILRREIQAGSLNPKTISHRLIETREYNVNIKIAAPIK